MKLNILIGGAVMSERHNTYEPTLLSNTNVGMKVNCAEVFGPIAVIDSFKDFDEAIAMTNDSDYGLQVGVYTNNFNNVKKHMKNSRLEA